MELWLEMKTPRAIAQELKEQGVHTTHTSVQRLIERHAVKHCDTQRGIAQALVRHRAAADQMLRIQVAAKMAEWHEIMRNPATDEDTRARGRVALAFLKGSDQLAERRQKLAAIGTLDADRDLWALQRKGLPDECEPPPGPAEAAPAPTASSPAEGPGPSVHPESVRFDPTIPLDSQQIEAYAPTPSSSSMPQPGRPAGSPPAGGEGPSGHPESVRFDPPIPLVPQQIEAYAPTCSTDPAGLVTQHGSPTGSAAEEEGPKAAPARTSAAWPRWRPARRAAPVVRAAVVELPVRAAASAVPASRLSA